MAQYYPDTQVIFPISVTCLGKFIAYLSQQGFKPASIQTRVAGLSYIHSVLDLPNPAKSNFIKKLLQGSKNLCKTPDNRRPITLVILHKLVDSLARLHTKYYAALFKAMFLLAFHALLRAGEITTRGDSWGHTTLRENVQFTIKEKVIKSLSVTLPHFKHSKHPTTLYLKLSKLKKYCPVRALWFYLRWVNPGKGPLFTHLDGSPITCDLFSKVLRHSIVDIGLDPAVYKPHSFRIGGMTWAHQQNVSESRLKEIGRWRSSAYKRYIRVPMVHC